MVLVKYFTFFCFAVGIIPFYCESNQFHNRSLYGTKINTSPKSSCLRFNNIHLVGLCLQTCMANVGIYYMLSYNKDQQACLCCTDFSGSEITDPSWKTYEISKYKPLSFFTSEIWYFEEGCNVNIFGETIIHKTKKPVSFIILTLKRNCILKYLCSNGSNNKNF